MNVLENHKLSDEIWRQVAENFCTTWAPPKNRFTVEDTTSSSKGLPKRSEESLLKEAQLNCLGKVIKITYASTRAKTTVTMHPSAKSTTFNLTPEEKRQLPSIVREVLEAGLGQE